MKTGLTLAAALLLTIPQTWAGPLTAEEAQRRKGVTDGLKKALAAEATVTGKLAVVAKVMKDEPSPDVRRTILDAALANPGPELDKFLTDVLTGDADAGVRSLAATSLGRHGSADGLAALAKAAATDRTTDIRVGDIGGQSSARRAATFAIAELAARHPKVAEDAAKQLRALEPAAVPKDTEHLADARLQALYQVTGDAKLIQPFYDRLRSPDAKVRVDGVVAFRFLKLKAAPPELVAAQKDEDKEVRSWANLVVNEIEKPKPPKP
jgi:HEAT repeat protein